MIRKVLSGLAVAALSGSLALAVPASATAAFAPYCGITWGSTTEAGNTSGTGLLTDVRAGRHPCFDRLVLDVRGKVGWYHVGYVDEIASIGEGARIPVRGGAKLAISVNASSYDFDTGSYSYDPADVDELVDVTGHRTFRQVVTAGTFEGMTDIGLGVRARLPFRVMLLDGPGSGSRFVVDVAHQWSAPVDQTPQIRRTWVTCGAGESGISVRVASRARVTDYFMLLISGPLEESQVVTLRPLQAVTAEFGGLPDGGYTITVMNALGDVVATKDVPVACQPAR
jgi:hypothetical protein